MTNRIICLLLITKTAFVFSQKIIIDEGNINNIQGISNYNIVFEYASDLEIPNYNSEEDFLDFQVRKREKKNQDRANCLESSGLKIELLFMSPNL